MKQCQAVTLSSTYSPAHRCLKKAAKKTGPRLLCAHHLAMERRRLAAGA